jgi:hypothetical protein
MRKNFDIEYVTMKTTEKETKNKSIETKRFFTVREQETYGKENESK